ncbi:DUF6528 family protein [Actinacidiphila glaucinigra]|uniref:DUF6528 family protein n=1 Tax=Actinacidiphila glaucinigra TaxID=235986 RepID=UPI002E367C72|nr:DUF6528 family protein [Actinacidiphila glaucinigra]
MTRHAARKSHPIATADQSCNGVLVFDPEATDWSGASAVTWRWSAPGGAGTSWQHLSDVRLRRTQAYGRVVLVAASGGRAAMVREDTGAIVWQTVTPADSPHAIERIPGGVIVVASGAPGRLRLYADTEQSTPFRTVPLPRARGVLYDPEHGALWAIGAGRLVRYTVSGRGAATTLTEHSAVRFEGEGRDLQPVYGEPGSLWFTDTYGVYRLDVATRRYRQVDGASGVSAYTSQPTGTRIRARSQAAGPRGWGGPTVEFLDADGTPEYARTRPGAEFATVRLWTPDFR